MLLLFDAYSKWPEVFPLGTDSTMAKMVEYLLLVIGRFGIPGIIVSDNGPQFTSQEFAAFCVQNGI